MDVVSEMGINRKIACDMAPLVHTSNNDESQTLIAISFTGAFRVRELMTATTRLTSRHDLVLDHTAGPDAKFGQRLS